MKEENHLNDFKFPNNILIGCSNNGVFAMDSSITKHFSLVKDYEEYLESKGYCIENNTEK